MPQAVTIARSIPDGICIVSGDFWSATRDGNLAWAAHTRAGSCIRTYFDLGTDSVVTLIDRKG